MKLVFDLDGKIVLRSGLHTHGLVVSCKSQTPVVFTSVTLRADCSELV